MKRLAVIALGCSLGFFSTSARAAIALDPKADALEKSIDKASEQGRIDQVEAFRLELAERYVTLNNIPEAIREYELLLASRPSKAKRVRYFTRLGQLQDQLNDY